MAAFTGFKASKAFWGFKSGFAWLYVLGVPGFPLLEAMRPRKPALIFLWHQEHAGKV